MSDFSITPKQTLEVLDFRKDGRRKVVHSFTQAGPILMGCDVTITSVREKLKAARPNWVQMSGKNMTALSHCVAIFVQGEGWMFFKTIDSFTKIVKAINKANP